MTSQQTRNVRSINFPQIRDAESKSVTCRESALMNDATCQIWKLSNPLSFVRVRKTSLIGRWALSDCEIDDGFTLVSIFRSRLWWKLMDLAVRAYCRGPSRSELPVFRKFPDFRKFCKKFLDFRKFYCVQKNRKVYFSRKFSKHFRKFDHCYWHLC